MDRKARSVSDSVIAALAPLILVFVAGHQLFLSQTASLDPWKGGGFGMFSTTEGRSARHTHVFVFEDGDEFEVDTSEDDLDDADDRLRTLPTDLWFASLAEQVAGEHPEHAGLRIELWFTSYDPDHLTPSTELMREYAHPDDD